MVVQQMSRWRRKLRWLQAIVLASSLTTGRADVDFDRNGIQRKRRIRNSEYDERGLLEAFLKQEHMLGADDAGR